jgi:hypothetical protein
VKKQRTAAQEAAFNKKALDDIVIAAGGLSSLCKMLGYTSASGYLWQQQGALSLPAVGRALHVRQFQHLSPLDLRCDLSAGKVAEVMRTGRAWAGMMREEAAERFITTRTIKGKVPA